MVESSKKKLTTTLLKCGVAAGPVYVIIGLYEILTRPGFSVFKHSLSLMSIGPQGWIHIALFVITGLLVILGAIGIRKAIKGERALRQGSGQAGTWAPILLTVYGLSLIAAGIFVPDPMRGFPPGMTYDTISTGGIMHLFAGMIGFIGLISACFVFARRFGSLKQTSMKIFSIITGFVFLFSFIGIAGFSGSRDDAVVMTVTMVFYFAVLLSWIWLSTVSSRLIK